jgi:hypothetical protein
VHGFFVGGVAKGIEFLENTVHPMGKPAMLGRSAGKGSSGSHSFL